MRKRPVCSRHLFPAAAGTFSGCVAAAFAPVVRAVAVEPACQPRGSGSGVPHAAVAHVNAIQSGTDTRPAKLAQRPAATHLLAPMAEVVPPLTPVSFNHGLTAQGSVAGAELEARKRGSRACPWSTPAPKVDWSEEGQPPLVMADDTADAKMRAIRQPLLEATGGLGRGSGSP